MYIAIHYYSMYLMYMQKAIKELFGNWFKEFRRPPKPRVKHSCPSISYKQKFPSLNVDLVMNLPAVPAGEDEAAFKQHNKQLIAESERNNPRMLTVNECMKKSFEMRRGICCQSCMTSTVFLRNIHFSMSLNRYITCMHIHTSIILCSTCSKCSYRLIKTAKGFIFMYYM